MKNLSPRLVRRAAAAGVSVAIACSVAACGGGSGSAASSPKGGVPLVSSGKLTICTHLPYKPFEFNQGGKVVGFDVSMLDLLAKKLGVQTSVISMDWSQIVSGAAFAAKQCDVGAGAATITPERSKAVLFSTPYFDANQALMVKSQSSYTDLASLKGKKLGVQTDTTGQIYADKQAKKYGYRTVVYPDSLSLFNAVRAGAVDAAISDNAPELDFANRNSGVKVTAEFDTGERYGFMVRKNDAGADKLVKALNTVIGKAHDDGTYKTIYQQWLGRAPKAAK